MFDGNRSQGCAFSVPVGNYTIWVTTPGMPWLVGRLVYIEGDKFSAPVIGDNFYAIVWFDQMGTATPKPGQTPVEQLAPVPTWPDEQETVQRWGAIRWFLFVVAVALFLALAIASANHVKDILKSADGF
jgi:hypothetical protein